MMKRTLIQFGYSKNILIVQIMYFKLSILDNRRNVVKRGKMLKKCAQNDIDSSSKTYYSIII